MTTRLTSQLAAEKIGNRFDLVLVAAQRVRELNHGATPRVEVKKGETNSSITLNEIEQGKYTKQEYLTTIHSQLTKKKKGYRDEHFPT
jgi:DNA-directed RNA polymerase subunit omega